MWHYFGGHEPFSEKCDVPPGLIYTYAKHIHTTCEFKMYNNLTMGLECFWGEMRANMNVWLMFCILLRWKFYELQSSSNSKNNIFNMNFPKISLYRRRLTLWKKNKEKKKVTNQSTVLFCDSLFSPSFTYRSNNVNFINRGRTEIWRWYEYI